MAYEPYQSASGGRGKPLPTPVRVPAGQQPAAVKSVPPSTKTKGGRSG